MDLLLCEVIYHGAQKHLGRLKCRSGVLESLDQHDWSPAQGLMEPRKEEGRVGRCKGEGKKTRMIERRGRTPRDVIKLCYVVRATAGTNVA